MTAPAIFLASFPAIQSAIKISGNGDGMRLQIDVPESEMAEAVKVLAWRECAIKITISPVEKNTRNDKREAAEIINRASKPSRLIDKHE